ncbi:MAG: flavohemoprotein [Pirellulaceae bacterium]|nr:MAG: flavohemoprotein [Pirellulaceae bacterium]
MFNEVLASASLATSAIAISGLAHHSLQALRHRRHVRHHRCRQHQAARTEAIHAFQTSVIRPPSRSPNGVAWRAMEIAEIVTESADCKSFYLIDPWKQQLPLFQPGQHILVRPPIVTNQSIARCYSLSSAPNGDYWRITVKRHDPQDWRRTAQLQSNLSYWMHTTLAPGDCLWIAGPSGTFLLPETMEAPLALIAAGVGITPLISMLKWSLHHRPGRPVQLFYQARDRAHWPFGEQLERWSACRRELTLHTYFSREATSRPNTPDSPGARRNHGRVTATEILAAITPETECFLCGPAAWMRDLRDTMVAQGHAASRIHWESFDGGLAAASTADGPVAGSAVGRQILFQRSELTTTWSGEEHSLWEVAQANGVSLPSGCLYGACGSCKTRLLSGEVEYSRQPATEIEPGHCLPCIACPTTDVVLDA